MLLYVNRDRKNYQGDGGAQDRHLDFLTAPELCVRGPWGSWYCNPKLPPQCNNSSHAVPSGGFLLHDTWCGSPLGFYKHT